MWTPETPLTVGDLRKVMEGLPDDAQMFVDGHPDRPIVGALKSEQIPDELVGKWEPGDPIELSQLVIGLELWLGGDDEFPAPRCKHSSRPKSSATTTTEGA
jgi:hypothetical protein